jgi:hypothetical protein
MTSHASGAGRASPPHAGPRHRPAPAAPLRQGHVPSDCVCHWPDRQMAGPTFPETDAQAVPDMIEPAPASAEASANAEPASHVPEHWSPYWHDVPLSRVHVVPFCGWEVGQPLSATPLSPQSPPTATQSWPLHTRLKGGSPTSRRFVEYRSRAPRGTWRERSMDRLGEACRDAGFYQFDDRVRHPPMTTAEPRSGSPLTGRISCRGTASHTTAPRQVECHRFLVPFTGSLVQQS